MSKILGVFAHMDDETLLCGGTLAKHAQDGDEVFVIWLADGVTSRPDTGQKEIMERLAMASAATDALGINGDCKGLPDQRLDTFPLLSLNVRIEEEMERFQPDVVFTHWDGDLNRDHLLVSKACQVACRSLGELFFVPPVGQWLAPHRKLQRFSPNVAVDIAEVLEKKQAALDCYRDELGEVTVTFTEEYFEYLTWTRWPL